ncbi:hypothetical protein [Streptomyces sp. NPDC056480]|uniref:hypothetical protein n=1 Tax=Streptomyces sp. NPDC056480 TaxID=3345833 RepID=UPI0036BE0523
MTGVITASEPSWTALFSWLSPQQFGKLVTALVPTRDHTIAERSKNYRYSTNHRVVMEADTRRIAVVGQPLAGNRNDRKAWEESGAKAAVGKTLTIADHAMLGIARMHNLALAR